MSKATSAKQLIESILKYLNYGRSLKFRENIYGIYRNSNFRKNLGNVQNLCLDGKRKLQ